jgi:hypothetical protein
MTAQDVHYAEAARVGRFWSFRYSLPVPLKPFPTWAKPGILGLITEIIELP